MQVSPCIARNAEAALTYYFSTHGCCRLVSSLLSPALGLELLDAAAAAARALLLKKLEAMCIQDSARSMRRNFEPELQAIAEGIEAQEDETPFEVKRRVYT